MVEPGGSPLVGTRLQHSSSSAGRGRRRLRVIAITFLALAVVAFAAAGSPFADTGGDVPRSPRRAERLERVDDDVADREGTAAAFVLPSGVASQRSATRNDELEPISATTEAMTASSKTMSATSEAKAETPHEGEGSHLLVVITPTYARPTNKPPPQANALLRMLNAMCQSSRQNILWIMVIEFGDADPAPKLPRCVPGRHTSTVHAVTIEVPAEKEKAPRRRDAAANGNATESFETKTKKKKPPPHRGVAQRNAGLAFARDRERLRAAIDEGGLFGGNTAELVERAKRPWDDPLVYFGDDDNEYDPRVFEEISKISKIGVWPVGFPFAMAPTHVEAPAVNASGSVVGFYSKFCDKRTYNVDMAGFALRVSAARTATFSPRSKPGHLEDDFLRAALGEGGNRAAALEPLADGATQVLVWHMGWKFDREKGKWKLMYEVRQPPDPAFVCAT